MSYITQSTLFRCVFLLWGDILKNFSLNSKHDVDITNGVVQLADGAELKRQTVECTLNTKKGEWFLNDDLGIDFDVIFVRQQDINEDLIRDTIMDGLSQVDNTFTINNFKTNFNKSTRKLKVDFDAINDDGENIALSDVWN